MGDWEMVARGDLDRLQKNYAISVAKECKCKNNIAVNNNIVNRNLELKEILRDIYNTMKSHQKCYKEEKIDIWKVEHKIPKYLKE